MKSLIATLILFLSLPCFAVSNRVIEDLKELKKIGFEITHIWQREEGVISFNFVSPSKFTFDSGDTEYTKPFSGISYMRTLKPPNEGPGLLGAAASYFHLSTRAREDHKHECRITLLTSDVAQCFFAVSFVRAEGGTWPMIIHIPVAKLLKQIKAEQGGADQPATAPKSKSEDNEKPKLEAEGLSQ